MSKYDVNFKRLALLLLPTSWRRPIIASITYAMVSPFSYIYTHFMRFRSESNYRLTHNGQVCYLRAVLNDTFDPIERRITITDQTTNIGNITLHLRSENQEKLLPQRGAIKIMIINRRGFGGVNGYDSWINIPAVLYASIDTTRVKAIVANYKLASKRFSINYV